MELPDPSALVSFSDITPALHVESLEDPSAMVMLFHGSGGSSQDLRFLVDELAEMLPYVKFILPQAPMHQSAQGGLRLWYTTSEKGPVGIEIPCRQALMELEELHLRHNIPISRVVFLGFSMGAVMAGHMAKSVSQTCAGLVLLSGRAPAAAMGKSKNVDIKRIPVLLCGLEGDHLMPIESMRKSRDALLRIGMHVKYHEFPHAGHAIVDEEIRAIQNFLQRQLPPIAKCESGHAEHRSEGMLYGQPSRDDANNATNQALEDKQGGYPSSSSTSNGRAEGGHHCLTGTSQRSVSTSTIVRSGREVGNKRDSTVR